ncbi:MAG: HAMP domain-containing protein [Lachnospiraceae bacterium]|jgi:methyl-accepting chemotaxis protein|nr:HAMP domain-containing protein [Lachnospiraceae bacterium]
MRIKPVRDVRIRTKLLLLGVISFLGMFILARESVSTALEIKEAGDEMSGVWMNAVIAAEELNTATSDYRIRESRHAVTTDPKLMEALEQELNMIREDIEQKFLDYYELPTRQEDQEIIQKAETAWKEYLEYSELLIDTSKGNDREKATVMMMGRSQELFNQASGLFLDAVAHDKRVVQVHQNQADELYQRTLHAKYWAIGLVSLFMGGLILYLIHTIERPVEELLDGARRVTNGNLDVRLKWQSGDELGTLTDAMNQLIQRLEMIVKDETRMFRETASEDYNVKSSCEQAYRGDFAPILYGFASLQSRLRATKQRREQKEAAMETELTHQKEEVSKLQDKLEGKNKRQG